ncbi:MAG: hypothetical protein H0U71_07900 [Gammaproteobacteria bacterium]|nr:hypothetical protein [Gammaproteobacteria bacterium]
MVNKQRILSNFYLYIMATLLTGIILFSIVYVPGFDYSTPLSYGGESLVINVIVKAIFDSKYYINIPFFSAPFSFSFIDFPIYTPLNFIAVRFLSLFFANYGSVLNTFYFSTYLLSTVISLSIFRRLALNNFFSLVAALLYSFNFYHVWRGVGHLTVNTYFVAPIFIYLAIIVFNRPTFLTKIAASTRTKKTMSIIGLCLLPIAGACCSSAGYFVLFGCYLIAIAGIIAAINKKNWAPILNAFFFISLSMLTFVASLSPTILKNIQYGPNKEAFARGPQESEVYALKITQLLFPHDGHRIEALKNFKKYYNQTAPLVNENTSASLGVLGSIGFLILLMVLFIRRWQVNTTLYLFSIFNISCVLFAISGGFCSVLAYTISPILHACNRISVYISFFSLFAFFMSAQLVIEKFPSIHNKFMMSFIAMLLLSIGLIDQLPSFSSNKMSLSKTQIDFNNDKKFVKQIETSLPAHSMIFQLPVIGFPDQLTNNWQEIYRHFMPYLHTSAFRWSYGVTNGSEALKWQQSLSAQSPREMLQHLAFSGYEGLYINRNWYKDKAQHLTREITLITKTKPLENASSNLVFYDLQPYIQKLKQDNPLRFQDEARKAVINTSLNISWAKGFSILETRDKKTWHWCDKKGCLKIFNFTTHNVPVNISFKVQTAYPGMSTLYITSDLFDTKININWTETRVSKKIEVAPGIHVINFSTNAKKVVAQGDPRSLYFSVNDFLIQPLS